MAGMLPGVEAARRRKFHQNINHNYNDATATTTRSSFSLYANNHKFQINSTSSMGNSTGLVFSDDEKLEAVAREAKKRLDQKLQTHRKSAEIKRSGNKN
ncbi:hypothetical protein ACJIZ3_020593 [Penstemon smallii]|uniref:Uncharacterized protein n=1 Tax=Penstemon smallii TaxID=265156 RepID=A0ABD3SJ55_9LAMI